MSFSEDRDLLGPLSAGNVVSAAIRIYRDRFKLYYSLALQAVLWSLVPVYGWAKCLAVAGVISRLVYGEIIERPETINDARRHVNPRMWNLFGASFLVGLIFVCITIAVIIIASIFSVFIAVIMKNNPNPLLVILVILLGVVAIIGVVFLYLWIFSRLSLYELSIVLEGNTNASSSIERSFQLTKGFAKRLQSIYGVSFLLTIPISILVQVIVSSLNYFFERVFSTTPSGIFLLIYFVVTVAISVVSNALLIPFWQAITSIVYYDLISRKEGLDLKMRNGLQEDF
jgi:hypothetical protein